MDAQERRMSRDGRYAAGAWMRRSGECPGTDGQKIAPAFSALPPSMAVVCRGRMDAQKRRMSRDERVHISSTLGDVPPHAPVKVFEIPMRICVGVALKGRRIGIRYSLFGSNLRKPARGTLRLLF